MNKDYSVEEHNTKEETQTASEKKFSWFHKGVSSEQKLDTSNDNKGLIAKIGIKNLAILLVLGILLIYLCCESSSNTKGDKTESGEKTEILSQNLESNPIYSESSTETEEYVNNLENRLMNILTKVNGIGKVEVMITLAESKELVTLKDTPYTQDSTNESDGEGGSRVSDSVTRDEQTVMTTTEDGKTTPYIVKEIQPTIEGVLVIAEGAKEGTHEVDIVEAVEALFNVPVHKIKVMEMEEK